MQTYLKSRPVWIQLLFFIGMAMAIFMIVLVLGGFLLSQMTGISLMNMGNYRSWTPNDDNVLFMLRGTVLLQFLGLFLIPSLLFGYLSDSKPMTYLGLKGPTPAIYWALGIGAMLTAVPFVEWTGLINKWMVEHSPFTGSVSEMEQSANRTIMVLLGKHTIGNLLTNLVFIALFAGIGEELFFRGILQRLLIRSTKSPWSGILISAFLFSFFHFQFLGFLPRFFLGVILGAVYWYSGSMWAAIIAHFLYDGFFIVLAYINPATASADASLFDGTRALLPMALASLVVTIFLIREMKRRSTTDFNSIYRDELQGPPPDNELSF